MEVACEIKIFLQNNCILHTHQILNFFITFTFPTIYRYTFFYIYQTIRSYTPVTGDEELGEVSFVIGVYKACVHPKFPDGGKISQYLDSLNIGDMIKMKRSKGHLEYFGSGKFTII